MPTGLALLRILDPEFETPAAVDYMYGSGVAFVLVIPILVDILLLAILLLGLPALWSLPLNGFAQMFPDYYMLIILCAAGLAVWGILRTILTLRQPQVAK